MLSNDSLGVFGDQRGVLRNVLESPGQIHQLFVLTLMKACSLVCDAVKRAFIIETKVTGMDDVVRTRLLCKVVQ